MKKSILLSIIILGLVLTINPVLAQRSNLRHSANFVGTVVSIKESSFTIRRNIPWYEYLFGTITFSFKPAPRYITFIVTNETEFLHKVAEGKYEIVPFSALAINYRVRVTAEVITTLATIPSNRTIIYKALKVFILSPAPTTTVTSPVTTRTTPTTNLHRYCISHKTGNKLTLEEALTIAQRDCTGGTIDITKEKLCNSITGTWWLGFIPDEPKEGCNPACVVSVDDKIAEVNWRCTGAMPIPRPTVPTPASFVFPRALVIEKRAGSNNNRYITVVLPNLQHPGITVSSSTKIMFQGWRHNQEASWDDIGRFSLVKIKGDITHPHNLSYINYYHATDIYILPPPPQPLKR